jgi:hypothetical protein
MPDRVSIQPRAHMGQHWPWPRVARGADAMAGQATQHPNLVRTGGAAVRHACIHAAERLPRGCPVRRRCTTASSTQQRDQEQQPGDRRTPPHVPNGKDLHRLVRRSGRSHSSNRWPRRELAGSVPS